MSQGELFPDDRYSPSAPYQRHSHESKTAAKLIEPKTGTLRAQVLLFIRERADHGATDDEIQVALKMDPSTERPRRIELLRAGLIKKSDKTRKTRSKKDAAVWLAVELERKHDAGQTSSRATG